jgi:hypothetical protein
LCPSLLEQPFRQNLVHRDADCVRPRPRKSKSDWV